MFERQKCYPLILVELRKGRKAGFREVEQRIRYLSVAFSKAGERLQKASLRLSENGSALRGTPVFSQEFTTKVVVLLGVSQKDGFGVESIVSYSMFRFAFHGFK